MALGPLTQLHISVTDLDRSIAFYRDILGLEHLFTVTGQPMAFFQSGQIRLYLGVPESPDFATKTVHYYEVTDIDAEYTRLTTAGVPSLGKPHLIHRDGPTGLWMAFFIDPDGHHIAITQQKPA